MSDVQRVSRSGIVGVGYWPRITYLRTTALPGVTLILNPSESLFPCRWSLEAELQVDCSKSLEAGDASGSLLGWMYDRG